MVAYNNNNNNNISCIHIFCLLFLHPTKVRFWGNWKIQKLQILSIFTMQHITVYNHRWEGGQTIPYQKKKSNPGRPIIPITIGPLIFQEVVYDFRASVNIMPKVIYDQINGDTLLYTNMHLQLVDQSLCYPREFLKMPLFEWDNHMFSQILWFWKQEEM